MRHRVQAGVLALIAAFILAAAVGQAGAEVLSVSNQNFRVTWSALEIEGGFGTIRCPVTMEGSFHDRGIPKNIGEGRIGYVNRATSGTCASGGMTILPEAIPWTVRYRSFTGTLPNITGVNLAGAGAAIRIREPVFGVTCLGTTTAERPLTLAATREAGGSLTTAAAGGTIPTSCGVNGTARGSGNITLTGSTTRIVLGLATNRGTGELSITPTPPITVSTLPAGTSVTLSLTGALLFGAVTITRIEVNAGGAIFTNNNGNCIRTIEWWPFSPRECSFTLFANAAGRAGRVKIEYERPEAESREPEIRS